MSVFTNYFLRNEFILRIVFIFLSEEQKERIIISRFRKELNLFGLDTSNLTDEDIKEATIKVGDVINELSFTMDEIAQTLFTMSKYNNPIKLT